ncbi:MAG: XRE family transcriptional regulator [Epsilonproteobacteria bacterium]|nr:XRE family transcriptional regulator [Campylobacterota bacterium]
MEEIKKIRALMEAQKISVTRMAELLNIPQGNVSNWFIRGGVPKKFLKKVASILGVTVDYILS